jgi:hypothetical protein
MASGIHLYSKGLESKAKTFYAIPLQEMLQKIASCADEDVDGFSSLNQVVNAWLELSVLMSDRHKYIMPGECPPQISPDISLLTVE